MKNEISKFLDAFQSMCGEFAEVAKQENEAAKARVSDCFVSEIQCEEFDW